MTPVIEPVPEDGPDTDHGPGFTEPLDGVALALGEAAEGKADGDGRQSRDRD
jgi:hypothetical protein